MEAGPEILTQRLRLSRLIAGDASAMYQYRSDPDVCRYQSFEPGSLADVEALIGDLQSVAFDTAGAWFQFGIRVRETGSLIGDIGARVTADDPRQVELGVTVAPIHQGRGFGTESVIGLLDCLLVDTRKHRVFASVDPLNKSWYGTQAKFELQPKCQPRTMHKEARVQTAGACIRTKLKWFVTNPKACSERGGPTKDIRPPTPRSHRNTLPQ